ncbi:MAG: hypothetical protein JXB85_05995 [Anaerolineales bacterium]|nr:hypothetical protein [Anaerolineales bacterium]
MAYLTIFTAPKPFTNPHIDIIQRNAIRAWKSLPQVEVILIGDEPGIPEAAKELGVKNVPQVERDEKGIPLVNSVMEKGHTYSESPFLCYANADMILMSDVLTATRQVASQAKDFLMVSQRWNLDLPEPFDFSGEWEARLRAEVMKRGEFYSPWGIDYFVFPRHMYAENVPDFTIGRPAWDNWMVYTAVHTWGLAVDATRSVTVIHQNHDYSHLPGNRPPYGSEVAKSNLAKAGGRRRVYNILDTNRELIAGKICRPRPYLARTLRRMERFFTPQEQKGLRWRIALLFVRAQTWSSTIPRK